MTSTGVEVLTRRQVSSAKRQGLHDTEFEMSFTYIRNKRGPSVEPRGTPIIIAFKEEWWFCMDTSWFRNER